MCHLLFNLQIYVYACMYKGRYIYAKTFVYTQWAYPYGVNHQTRRKLLEHHLQIDLCTFCALSGIYYHFCVCLQTLGECYDLAAIHNLLSKKIARRYICIHGQHTYVHIGACKYVQQDNLIFKPFTHLPIS